ncbi:SPOR domain-containing protein, partial [Ottowia sp.]|uniref:SPOR domain-containing protein n=1 Tax=Ottowia sp. TaxID=1898956 RepID=UPI0039E52E77
AGGGTAGGAVAPTPEPAPIPAPAETRQAGNRPAVVPAPAEVEVPRAAASKPAARTAEKPADATARPGTAVQIQPPSNDPLGDFAAARAGAQPPAPAAAADPFTYFVQAGAFRTPDDAEAQRARLSLMGVQARVTEREQAGRTVYRVRVGPFQNKDAADRVKERLDGNGFDSALVRVQR